MLLGNIEIVLGQVLIHPDCKGIHYTDNQDKRCLECLVNKPKRDSLLINSKFKIDNLQLQISEFKEQKIILNESISDLNKGWSKDKKRLKFSLNLNKYGIPIALGGGLLIGILIK
jgi:hypothetical protein